ncbi:type ISP restriction/modification enzyme [Acetobacter fabarum]|uniref:type ISP restriction/modification enzyme n=1 Tax=Acetobacter fabarum TaxID=483199 RepID=UPI0015CC412D
MSSIRICSRTGQDRTGQDRTGQDRTGQDNYTRRITEVQEKNLVICISGPGEDRPFSTMMMFSTPDLHLLHGGQCFPMFVYKTEDSQ